MSSSRIIRQAKLAPQAYPVAPAAADGGPRVGPSAPPTPQELRVREEILNQALREAEELRREAQSRGYQEGLVAAHRETERLLRTLEAVVGSAKVDLIRSLRHSESAMVRLALEVGTKLALKELADDPSLVMKAIEQAMDYVVAVEAVRLRLHPEDTAIVGPEWLDAKANIWGLRKVDIIADEEVKRGGCLIETELGLVDARVETRLAQIGSALKAAEGNDNDSDA